ncbi:hypothetical protein HHK36_005300 [Tetracentron sinense]|uniref:Uncharacterized protein n=1 Tax=Tetracentron sinense TaxID=13715 RepID=A0A834ZL74_TETSI|nr:hypothetical protein HHK36_005300 [Tetracentron sinense]
MSRPQEKDLMEIDKRDESSHGENLEYNGNKSSSTEKPLRLLVLEKVQPVCMSEIEAFLPVRIYYHVQAFTDSIIEHTHSIQTNPVGQDAASSQSTGSHPSKPVSRFITGSHPSKPVSRFKLQKGSC